MSEHTSTIVSIIPPDDVIKSISEWNSDVDETDNLHVTLVFLGEVGDDQIDTIVDAVKKVCSTASPMHCKTQGLGVFDHEDEGGQPIYASVDAVGMAELRTNLINEIESSGFTLEKKYDFTPHMTLSYADPSEFDFTGGSPAVEWECDEVVIIRADERLEPIKLGGKIKVRMADVNIVDEPESNSSQTLSMPSEYPAGGMVDDIGSVHHETPNIKREPAAGPTRSIARMADIIKVSGYDGIFEQLGDLYALLSHLSDKIVKSDSDQLVWYGQYIKDNLKYISQLMNSGDIESCLKNIYYSRPSILTSMVEMLQHAATVANDGDLKAGINQALHSASSLISMMASNFTTIDHRSVSIDTLYTLIDKLSQITAQLLDETESLDDDMAARASELLTEIDGKLSDATHGGGAYGQNAVLDIYREMLSAGELITELGSIASSVREISAGYKKLVYTYTNLINGAKMLITDMGLHKACVHSAGGFGENLDELTGPSDINSDDMPQNMSYHNDNTSEDIDTKLGLVEEPYSSNPGPMPTRTDDVPPITRGASADGLREMIVDLSVAVGELSEKMRDYAYEAIDSEKMAIFADTLHRLSFKLRNAPNNDIASIDVVNMFKYSGLFTTLDMWADKFTPEMTDSINRLRYMAKEVVAAAIREVPSLANLLGSARHHISIALPDNSKDENKYEDDLFREDQSIVRNPEHSGPIYGK